MKSITIFIEKTVCFLTSLLETLILFGKLFLEELTGLGAIIDV